MISGKSIKFKEYIYFNYRESEYIWICKLSDQLAKHPSSRSDREKQEIEDNKTYDT